MNVQDVVTRVRRVFGDEAAVQVSNDDIIRWINDAQIEIVKKNDAALQKSNLIDLVANQSTYALPADLLIIRSLRYKYTDMLSFVSLKYRSMQQFDDVIDGWDGSLYGTGSPYLFTMDEGRAILFPTPDRSVTNGLKVRYNQQPTAVANLGDSLALPIIYHHTIFTFCMWQASLLDEDHEPAVMYRGDFETDVQTLVNRENREATDTYPRITTLAEDL